jgi:hypothetical protein
MKVDHAERFEGLLTALERELTEATDEEILEAASDLRMNPAMKGSAAFFGIAMRGHPPFPGRETRESADVPSVCRRLKDDSAS